VELRCGGNHKSSGGKGGSSRRGWSDRPGGGGCGCGSWDDDDDLGCGCGGAGCGVVPLDAPDHNFTPCLTLDALVDGQFAARLDLDRIPYGDITIRVRNYRLEVIVDRAGDPPPAPGSDAAGGPGTESSRRPDDAHRVSRPFYCGSVDIPIYVDMTTIRLQTVDDGRTDALCVTARMKVCRRGLSLALRIRWDTF